LTQPRHNKATDTAVHLRTFNQAQRAGNKESEMNFTRGTMAVAALAIGVSLGGCATRDSVEKAQASADAADHHAGTAQARADEAYGVGNNALGVGNNALNVGNGAMASAQQANSKADQNTDDVGKLKRKVAYLEWKVLPHHKKRHHHHALPAQPKSNNS
jgi:hypothetical protein